jgi:hypothetical protein
MNWKHKRAKIQPDRSIWYSSYRRSETGMDDLKKPIIMAGNRYEDKKVVLPLNFTVIDELIKKILAGDIPNLIELAKEKNKVCTKNKIPQFKNDKILERLLFLTARINRK